MTTTNASQPVKSRNLKLFLGLGTVSLGLALVWLVARNPALELPRPPRFDQLEPQLSAYLSSELDRMGSRSRRAEDHSRIGLIAAVNGLWHEAAFAFSNSVVLKPDQPLALMYWGVAAQEINELENAIDLFRRCTTEHPQFMPGFYRLGFALLARGSAAEAEAAFAELTRGEPGEWRGHAGLGECKLRLGKPREALAPLQEAIRIHPSAGSAHALLAQALRSLGQTNEAVRHALLGESAAATPMPDAWSKSATEHMRLLPDQFQLANDLALEGRPLDAVRILANAYSFHETNVAVINQLAIALNRSGQPNKSSRLLDRALEIDPANVPALVSSALVRNQLEQNQEALLLAERAIALAPNLAQPLIAKASALLGLERDEDALQALEKAATLDPKNPEIPIEMGDVFWRNLKRNEAALSQYRRARSLNPVSFKALSRLFEFSLEQGWIEEARSLLKELQSIHPTLTESAGLERALSAAAQP